MRGGIARFAPIANRRKKRRYGKVRCDLCSQVWSDHRESGSAGKLTTARRETTELWRARWRMRCAEPVPDCVRHGDGDSLRTCCHSDAIGYLFQQFRLVGGRVDGRPELFPRSWRVSRHCQDMLCAYWLTSRRQYLRPGGTDERRHFSAIWNRFSATEHG